MRVKAQYFGLDISIDEQVLKLIKNGIINTCSIVVNNLNLEKNVADLMKNCKQKGLMINLTQGCSLQSNSESLISSEQLKKQIQENKVNLNLIKSEIRAQIYKYIKIFEELPLHIDGFEEIHQIPEISNIIAQIMEQELGIYEIHFQMRNILLSEREINQQIQLINKLIKVYCSHNIKPVIYMEQEDLFLYKESLNKINSKIEYDYSINLRYGITLTKLAISDINSQQIPKIMPQKRLSQSSQKISQIIKKICSDQNQLNKTNILIYSKINPATGNQTFALRLKKILDNKYMNQRKVFLRGIDQFNQNDNQSFQNEVKNLSQFIQENKIGMCLGINVYRTSIILSKVKKNVNFDLISIIAGTDAYEFLENDVTAQQMKEACEQSSLVISINEEMKQNFMRKFGIPDHQIPVINQSIDLSLAKKFDIRQELGLSERDKLILFPAGVRKVKNCKFLIEPMKKLLLKYPNHFMVHVGSILEQSYHNEYLNEIEKIKQEFPSLSNRFIFYGSLDYPSYLGALQQSDLVLNCSFSEGQCNAILEAMGSKIITLISRIEGNKSICEDQETSIMFEGEEEFTDMYEKIFNSKIDTTQLIENAFKKFQECYDFSIEEKGFSDLFSQVDSNACLL
ncbi:group 1 family glycosyltransferase (macronuclear) [Tetrahymena thermophila SB210]|uniref:Carbohydrate deacetylase n=1 Tax=Tetrahymena thermophila (strain SB210) TaxID=312017 RepID=I7MEX0_TETTS|nr:group 1 family glycosyltransferase [Tetrahymena thermophila SB210]EAR97956.2 group 1 family glycosyltransferase [Tetrahymena thermophila SB210]|eukprot:XP_001018201.2 group 1 family glycosyltransferase [Tetrahymena thermophila SB210]